MGSVSMDVIDRAYDRACCELSDILDHPKFDKQDVEFMGAFVDILKDIDKMDKSQDMGYSQMGGYSRGRMYPMMYNRGSSYRGGYSRDESKEHMLDELSRVMDMAVDEKDRKAISRLMEQMENN